MWRCENRGEAAIGNTEFQVVRAFLDRNVIDDIELTLQVTSLTASDPKPALQEGYPKVVRRVGLSERRRKQEGGGRNDRPTESIQAASDSCFVSAVIEAELVI